MVSSGAQGGPSERHKFVCAVFLFLAQIVKICSQLLHWTVGAYITLSCYYKLFFKGITRVPLCSRRIPRQYDEAGGGLQGHGVHQHLPEIQTGLQLTGEEKQYIQTTY